MDFRKITIAAMKAATTEEEVSYVFSVFGFATSKEKADLLQETMGGKWFDLPKDDNTRYRMLLASFLQGEWRYADRLSQLKNIANTL